MMQDEVERYGKPTRVLHWSIAVSFTVLLLTGLILFLPAPIAALARDSWTRVLHRLFAVAYIVAPAIYVITNWKKSIVGAKEAFRWGPDDIGWLKAAPRYYFLSDEETMPPQGHMNTGQKLWWLMVIVLGMVLVLSGLVMWLLKTVAPAPLLQWMVFAHDVAFIASGSMFLVHVYLSAIHPLMRPWREGSMSSMTRGRVSAAYARSHHAKWYSEEIASKHEEEVARPRRQPTTTVS
jgi:formate dehydrogenase subunit gamma